MWDFTFLSFWRLLSVDEASEVLEIIEARHDHPWFVTISHHFCAWKLGHNCHYLGILRSAVAAKSLLIHDYVGLHYQIYSGLSPSMNWELLFTSNIRDDRGIFNTAQIRWDEMRWDEHLWTVDKRVHFILAHVCHVLWYLATRFPSYNWEIIKQIG